MENGSPDVGVEALLSLGPDEFEALIADWLTSLGWYAKQTSRTRDGGIDIVASNPDPIAGGRYLVQCKRYAPGNPVGASAVREFYGVLQDQDAVRGLFVTTSAFTRDAIEFTSGKRITLLDGPAICSQLLQAGLLERLVGSRGQGRGDSPPEDERDSPLPPNDTLEYVYEIAEEDPAEAEAICVELARNNREWAEAWECLGYVRKVQGRDREGLENYRRALSLVTEVWQRRHLLTLVGSSLIAASYADKARAEEYVKEAEQHLLTAASEGWHPLAEAHYWLFVLYLREYEREHHTKYLREAAINYSLGRVFCVLRFDDLPSVWAQEDFEEALEDWFEGEIDDRGEFRGSYWYEALDRVGAEAQHAAERGTQEYARGEWANALRSYECACQGEPDVAANWRTLGYLYGRSKRYREAAHAYAVYLALRPEAEDAGEVERYLTQLRERLGD